MNESSKALAKKHACITSPLLPWKRTSPWAGATWDINIRNTTRSRYYRCYTGRILSAGVVLSADGDGNPRLAEGLPLHSWAKMKTWIDVKNSKWTIADLRRSSQTLKMRILEKDHSISPSYESAEGISSHQDHPSATTATYFVIAQL